ncbi:hypothetical protein ACLI4Q_20210 [Natrialbaceae archaeon A-CW1-1]
MKEFRATEEKKGQSAGSNTLVLSKPPESDEVVTYIDRLSTSSSQSTAIITSHYHSSQSIIDSWRNLLGPLPPNLGIISVGESMRSTAAGPSTIEMQNTSVSTVSEKDITGISIALNEYINRWKNEPQPVLWFDSVTPLEKSVGLETTFRFLHLVTGSVQWSNIDGFYHMDPSAHDEQTIHSIMHLFDNVVELE